MFAVFLAATVGAAGSPRPYAISAAFAAGESALPEEAEADALLESGDRASADRSIVLLEAALAKGSLTASYKLAEALDLRGAAGDLKLARDTLLKYRPAVEKAYAGRVEMALFLRTLATVSYDSGLSQEALDAALEERKIVTAIGTFDRWPAQIDASIGVYLEDLGRYPEALASLQAALPQFEKAYGRNDPRSGDIHNNMAIVYESMSDYGQALTQYREALRISTAAYGADHIEAAQLYDNIGGVLDRLGRSGEGLAAFQKATPIFIKTYGPDHPAVGRHYADMATVLVALHRYPEALDLFDEAVPRLVAGFGEKSKYIAAVYLNKANLLTLLGERKEALETYKKAQGTFDAVYGAGNPDSATVEVEMGGLLTEMGQPEEGLKMYNEAAPVYARNFGEVSFRNALLQNDIGISQSALKRYDDAIASYRRSLDIRTSLFGPAHSSDADVQSNMANSLVLAGRPDEALKSLVEALSIYWQDKSGNLDSLRKTYLVLADALKTRGEMRSATVFAKLAVNAHQDLRLQNAQLPPVLAQALARSLKPAYDLLIAQQVADGAFAEAQFAGALMKSGELVAFSRGTSDKEQTAAAQARLTNLELQFVGHLDKALGAPARIGKEIQKLVAARRLRPLQPRDASRLEDLTRQYANAIAKAGQDVVALFSGLEAERQKLQGEELKADAQHAANLQKLLAELGPGVALYQAISTDDTLHLFVAAAGRPVVHREVKIDRAKLAGKVFQALTDIESRDSAAVDDLRDLDSILIAPVTADLDTLKPRVVMLDLAGFLRYVPYAALNAHDRYLIEDYALALYTPAAKTKFQTAARSASDGAGFGVTQPERGFPALPGVQRELESIFGSDTQKGPVAGVPMFDANFTVDSLKAALKQHPRIVHIASHFKFEPGNETQSFLLLGDGSELTLADLRSDRGLRFAGVDLLALSACETARGGGSEGEEIESFGALAQLSGASAVLATLWQIADQSSASLMADFYANLVTHGLDKATALQRAQIDMLRGTKSASSSTRGVTPLNEQAESPVQVLSTRHPYYWSGFILMGNWL